jgi:hypothetical protein
MRATKGQIKAMSLVFPFKGIEDSSIIFEFGSNVEFEGMVVFDGSFIAQIPNGARKKKTIVRFDCKVSKSGYSVKTKEIKVK